MLFPRKIVSFLIIVTVMPLLCSGTNSLTRLPSSIVPTNYFLHINTNIHRNITDYRGIVTIDINIKENTNQIILHAKLLRGFKITLTNDRTNEKLQSHQLQFRIDHETEQLRIFRLMTPLDLRAGEKYKLKIQFVGDIRDDSFGFYRSSFSDSIPSATTHFEPISARKAFPCFDEQALKATFTISITHGSNYTALSNMPAVYKSASSYDETMTTTKFQNTPPMSSYLVAFAVVNFNHTAKIVNGIEHRIFFHNASENIGTRAIENSGKALTTFGNYFGIEYAVPKLDHLLVSNVFGVAMENWGLMVFGHEYVLPDVKSTNQKYEYEGVITQNHEIAHQWFGNLVTPKWITQSWLKEGFGTYYSYVVADLVYPGAKYVDYFLGTVDTYHNPLTHALTFNNSDQKPVDYFDQVTYLFGGVIVRMFHHAIGHKTFTKGITFYLKKFQYSAADEEDLFGSLQLAVDNDGVRLFQNPQSVATVMRSWTHNVGIPIVTVIRNYNTGTLTIRQESFNEEYDQQKWYIPLNFVTASNPDFNKTTADYIMPPQRQVTLNLKDLNINLSRDDWLIVNKQQTGFFHIVYDNRNLRLIIDTLKSNHEKIHLLNRAKIFNDFDALYAKDLVAVDVLLEAFSYLKYEKESLPWVSAIRTIFMILSRLREGKALAMFQKFVHETAHDIFKRIEKPSHRSAIDFLFTEIMFRTAYEVDLIDCHNFTSNFPKDFYFGKLGQDKEPCKFSLCQGLRNASFTELQAVLKSHFLEEAGDLSQYNDVLAVVECVGREKYRKLQTFMFDKTANGGYHDKFERIKPFLLEWSVVDASNMNFLQSLLNEEGMTDLEDSYKAEMKKKRFVDKNEERIYVWLENYMGWEGN